jgi:hypothetical protein
VRGWWVDCNDEDGENKELLKNLLYYREKVILKEEAIQLELRR